MDRRHLGLTDDDETSLAPRGRVVRLALGRDEDGLGLTLRLRSDADGELREIHFTGVHDLRFRDADTTLQSAVHFLVAGISHHGWQLARHYVREVEGELLDFFCASFGCETLPAPSSRRTGDARELVRAFAALQRKLVSAFLAHYQPSDRERFLGVPPGLFFVEGHEWKQHRHGAGVRFMHVQLGHVDAHVDLATHPGAVDAFRLSEYLASIDVGWVELDGSTYEVEHRDMERLIAALAEGGVLRPVERRDGHGGLFELV